MRGGQRYVGFRQRARNHGWKAIRTSKLSLINVTFGNRVQPPIFHSILWNAASNRSPDFYRNTFPFEIVVKLASKGKYYKEDEKRKLLFVWADVVEAPSRIVADVIKLVFSTSYLSPSAPANFHQANRPFRIQSHRTVRFQFRSSRTRPISESLHGSGTTSLPDHRHLYRLKLARKRLSKLLDKSGEITFLSSGRKTIYFV